jgi:hypothetical protein
MKVEMFVMARNSLLMRVENIGDIYDNDSVVVQSPINMQALADGLYKMVNNNVDTFTATIEELSLTGNQS